MKFQKYTLAIIASIFALAFARGASAAVLYAVPGQGSFGLKDEVNVDIKINSEGEGINAAQAAISWPVGILEFVEVSKAGSTFNFWVEEPTVGAASNSLSFIGGTAKGVSGTALQILRLKFRVKGTGVAELAITDAAITASDGKGTNVLSRTGGGTYTIGGAEIVQPKAPEPAQPAAPQPVKVEAPAVPQPTARPVAPAPAPTPQPVRVQRLAVPATKLPPKPEITVPLYPEQQKWNNHSGETVALWKVPDDVTAMAVLLDHSPNTQPTAAEKELATGKKFGVPEDGEWFVHARFRNALGWGPTAHYRIAIDTKPPISFEVTMPEGETTDNPTPVLEFKTSDTLSGLKEYHVKIGDSDSIGVPTAGFTGRFTLPSQLPGARPVVVRAIDHAGNSIEDDVKLEIIPIASPTIIFVPEELFSDEEKGLTAKGTALPSVSVVLRVYRGESLVVEKTVAVDEKGNWDYTFDQTFKNGKYKMTAQSQDARGASSLVVESAAIVIKSKPIIQLGPLQVGKGGAALALLLVIALGFGGGAWSNKKRQEKLAMRVSFTESEIAKIFQLLKSDVDTLKKALQTPTTSDDDYTTKRLEENIKKMETYLKRGVEKIKRS